MYSRQRDSDVHAHYITETNTNEFENVIYGWKYFFMPARDFRSLSKSFLSTSKSLFPLFLLLARQQHTI